HRRENVRHQNQAPRRTQRALHNALRPPHRSPIHPRRSLWRRSGGEHRLPRRISLHPRHLLHHVPRPPLDHAPVRRLRHRRRIQPTLSLSPQQRPSRPFRSVRSANANRHGLGPSPRSGRGRQSRRGHRFPRRHGNPLRQHPAGKSLHLDDHQRQRRHPPLPLRSRRQEARRQPRQNFRHRTKRHPQGIHRARHLYLSSSSRHAHRHRHFRLVSRQSPQVEHHLHLRLPHSRSRLDRHPGSRLHASRRHRLRSSRPGRRTCRRRIRSPALLLLQRSQ